MKIIAVIGALDTKGLEFNYLVNCIHARKHTPFVIDTSVIGNPTFPPDIQSAEVIAAGGSSLEELRARADRGFAMQILAKGIARIVEKLYSEGRMDAILGMGGSGGTSIFASAVRSIPVGFPKVLITTMASGDTTRIVGIKDLVLYPSVVDISGLNRVSRRIFANAVGAICGMVESTISEAIEDRPLIAATMLGNTTQAVDTARTIFEAAGYEVLIFHAIGSGGRTMESLISDGMFAGIFDFTTTELASELAHTSMSAGPDRLKIAGELGVPMIIVPGCLDFSIFNANELIPPQFARRNFYQWNPEAILMRTTPKEAAVLGNQIAERANLSCGPVAIFLPLRGLSLLDIEGGPYWNPGADQALFNAIRKSLRPGIPLIEMEMEVNDPSFARQAADQLLSYIG